MWMNEEAETIQKLKMTLTTEEWKHETWGEKGASCSRKSECLGGREVPAFIHIQTSKILIYSTDNLIWIFFEADDFFSF